MGKQKNRFVPIDELKELLKQREELEEKINSFDPNHCNCCGDTKPKHNFYPLLGMAIGNGIYQTSDLMCNRCARTDEDYEEIFGEPKEVI